MSAIAALRGYRTQFLYSLHFMLSNISNDYVYQLEGHEDLDVLDSKGTLLYAIQLKNLGRTLTIADLLSESKTSFLKRFVDRYPEATPILVSYSPVSADLLEWKNNLGQFSSKDKKLINKYKLTEESWQMIRQKTVFIKIDETEIHREIIALLKDLFPAIDPGSTLDFLLTRMMHAAESRQSFNSMQLTDWIQHFAQYLSERIAVHEQAGIFLRPLRLKTVADLDHSKLEAEFYKATTTRFEHVLLGLNVRREELVTEIRNHYSSSSVVILTGASGQGKTTLAYDYACTCAASELVYELVIQDDPIQTQKSIQSVAAISKKLDTPLLVIINVTPNTTDWIKVVRESVHFKHIHFLVAVRHEDWYRARGVGIEFAHKEIELALKESEARIIYARLIEKTNTSHHLDFEEAWIKLGSTVPLLEFVYYITQGDSLENKLYQQVRQLVTEDQKDHSSSIRLLKLVSIADAFGARIDLAAIHNAQSLQFDIQKLEKEYLLKQSVDGKYLQGLHMVRSGLLVELLFDEATSFKRDVLLELIPLVAGEDRYLFLLQALHQKIISPQDLIAFLDTIAEIDWSLYAAVVKALIWSGIRQYVDLNRPVLDELRDYINDGWYAAADILFGVNVDIANIIADERARSVFRAKVTGINSRLQPKEKIFVLAAQMVKQCRLPNAAPKTAFGWQSLGEVLFWAGSISKNLALEDTARNYDFNLAVVNCNCQQLAKLMLGMNTFSPALSLIGTGLEEHFITRLTSDYDIMECRVIGDEIRIDYIVDLLDTEKKPDSNSHAVMLVDLVRTAFPYMKLFSTQGHGHRFLSIPSVDDTRKSIPVENLPLDEWVGINSCIIATYEYPNRPKDWVAYRERLMNWEKHIKSILVGFSAAFTLYGKKTGDYSRLRPVFEHAGYRHSPGIDAPQSVTDPLGIFHGKSRSSSQVEGEQPSEKLKSRYDQFFKGQVDFKTDIENHISQCASTVRSLIEVASSLAHTHDENIERLSQTNLFAAHKSFHRYADLYNKLFISLGQDSGLVITGNDLLDTAVRWRNFLARNFDANHSLKRIDKIKTDFESRLRSALKTGSVDDVFQFKYLNSPATAHKPVVFIEAPDYLSVISGVETAYGIVQACIDKPAYTSLKYLMLQKDFSDIYFLSLIKGSSLLGHWQEIPLHAIMEKSFHELAHFHHIPKPIPAVLIESMPTQSWASRFPVFYEITKLTVGYMTVSTMIDHLYDLRYFNTVKLSDYNEARLKTHIDRCGKVISDTIETIFTLFGKWMKLDAPDEEVDVEDDPELYYAMIKLKDALVPGLDNATGTYQFSLDMTNMDRWLAGMVDAGPYLKQLTGLLYEKFIRQYS